MKFEPIYFDDYLVLFYQGHIREIREYLPDDVYTYEIRHSDEGFEPCELARTIFVNHYGSIISYKKLLNDNEYYMTISEGDLEFALVPSMAIEEYVYNQKILLNEMVR